MCIFNNLIKILVILGCCVFGAVKLIADDLEAKKDGVQITIEAKKDSKVLATLKKGDAVEAIQRKGMYWQIKTKEGKEGFVSVLQVNRKSDDSKSSLAKAIRAAASEGRGSDEVASARARSAVMGVRGAMADEETAGAGQVKPNLRQVYAMEDYSVSKKAIAELAKQVGNEVQKKADKVGL